MNPDHFANRTVREVLSTLVHEMVHLWQHHFGKPGRGRYYNREWAGMMLELGLHPSTTGEPGGGMTGDRVTHYIVKNDHFDVVTRELLTTGFKISWLENVATQAKKGGQGGNTLSHLNTRLIFSCSKCQQYAWA